MSVHRTAASYFISDNNFRHCHWLKVHHVAFVLFRYPISSKGDSMEYMYMYVYDIARLGGINLNKF